MKNTTPTAKEYLNSSNCWHSEDYESLLESLLIGFANLHLKRQKAAIKKVVPGFGHQINNAYPIDNIK